MSHYAQIINGRVEQVIVADQAFIDAHCTGKWVQTSYNTRGGVHYDQTGKPDGGVALRANFASVGGFYDEAHDAFYAASPYPSWTLNQKTWLWEAPIPAPTDGKPYEWLEGQQKWVNVIVHFNKEKAKALLKESDWCEEPSVSDITRSVSLANLDEFLDYREKLRCILVLGPDQPVQFPAAPEPVWNFDQSGMTFKEGQI